MCTCMYVHYNIYFYINMCTDINPVVVYAKKTNISLPGFCSAV